MEGRGEKRVVGGGSAASTSRQGRMLNRATFFHLSTNEAHTLHALVRVCARYLYPMTLFFSFFFFCFFFFFLGWVFRACSHVVGHRNVEEKIPNASGRVFFRPLTLLVDHHLVYQCFLQTHGVKRARSIRAPSMRLRKVWPGYVEL